jgi:aminopeptidase N
MPLVTIGVGAALSMILGQHPRPQAGPIAAAGVPLALAEDRATRISGLQYDLTFTIPSTASLPIDAREVIRFTLADAGAPLVLDFAAPADHVSSVSSAGRPVEYEATTDHLVIHARALRPGANELTVVFRAGDAPLNRNPDFLYTIFVPARAHLAFPCFDQPDLKAVWRLALDVPRGWEVLGNGSEVERRDDGDRTRVRFADTQPLPTYLFAFAAGRFSVETAERGGRRFRMFHRETDRDKVARNRETIFDLHAAALDWLERYTAIPYPFGKFDFLLVPSFQFGGMEHAGAIFYNASGLLLDPSATQNQKLARASVIAHETSHMWFGDLVTMRWFNDVWMKEVFANFMAAKIVNPSFPEINHQLRFLLSYYPAAYDVDRTPGTNAIRQRLDNLSEAGTLYGAIIYQKAPIVMRQLETMLGEDGFRDGLREYLRAHAFGNATWPDLIKVLDARTPEDLQAWSHAWVEEAGRPNIATQLSVGDGRIARLAVVQSDPAPSRGLVWNQRLQVAIGAPGGVRILPVRVAAREADVTDARGLPQPSFVLPSAGGIGYAGFSLDPASRAYLLAHLPELDDELLRGSAWVTLWEEMLDGRVAPSDLLSLAIAALPRETDELNVQRVLAYTQHSFWEFVPDTARQVLAPRLESVLRAGLDAADTTSLKSAWFSALRDIAHSPAVLRWLESVWRKTEQVPGLTLAEPDYITLALELAVREVPAWEEILDQQAGRIQNPDRKARFEFVRPALSPDLAARDAFFASLRDVRNRRHEPWVLEALSYLHHPLRAASAERYISPGLAMLREIQRTGDIFFPKRWADATLGGHGSPSAARMVETFLAGLPPDYPDRLRRIVLSSADDLFRATRLPR